MYDAEAKVFTHYDSMHQANYNAVKPIVRNLGPLLGCTYIQTETLSTVKEYNCTIDILTEKSVQSVQRALI